MLFCVFQVLDIFCIQNASTSRLCLRGAWCWFVDASPHGAAKRNLPPPGGPRSTLRSLPAGPADGPDRRQALAQGAQSSYEREGGGAEFHALHRPGPQELEDFHSGASKKPVAEMTIPETTDLRRIVWLQTKQKFEAELSQQEQEELEALEKSNALERKANRDWLMRDTRRRIGAVELSIVPLTPHKVQLSSQAPLGNRWRLRCFIRHTSVGLQCGADVDPKALWPHMGYLVC